MQLSLFPKKKNEETGRVHPILTTALILTLTLSLTLTRTLTRTLP